MYNVCSTPFSPCTCTYMYVCIVQCVCDWPSFKMNCPTNQQFLHVTFHWNSNGKIKETHELSITEGSRLLIQFERTRSQCTTVSTTQLLISLYSVRRTEDGAPAVCAEFLGAEIGTGWEYSGKCALRQHYCWELAMLISFLQSVSGPRGASSPSYTCAFSNWCQPDVNLYRLPLVLLLCEEKQRFVKILAQVS